MKFVQPNATVFVPDGTSAAEALARITHLGIGAHQDDLEIMAFHGIRECYGRKDLWFGGVTCTDGAGSARVGVYAAHSDDDMKRVRHKEQEKAAAVGDYSAMIQLNHPSQVVKSPTDSSLRSDLDSILQVAQPRVVYTHNPADKHDTHIGVLLSVLESLRALPMERRPTKLFGCEVWRGLDWMVDSDKVALDVGGRDHLFHSLVGIFDSQIAGGKRYDLATIGRARANATYYQSHRVDTSDLLWFAMDLSPLLRDDQLDLIRYVDQYMERFAGDVRSRLAKRMGRS
ncbi:MAG: PIG-L family deacetylase [Kiritimatiellae bacterium]|nr:PIG-L family deacetylase [Kiritimatiellia bacterium]